MNYAVIGDIHANIFALDSCLDSIEKFENNRNTKLDRIFFIGDLLTYGVNINQTLARLIEFKKTHKVEFIMGNHDEMYFKLLKGEKSIYFDQMADWIKISVESTLKEIDTKLFNSIKMKKAITLGNVLICHANCLILNSSNKNKWVYIDSYKSYLEEAFRLSKTNFKLAVYGHTHRRKIFFRNNQKEILFIENPNFHQYSFNISKSSLLILNTGSIGQPRSFNDLRNAWLYIKEDSFTNKFIFRYVDFDYDTDKYLNSIRKKYESNLETYERIKIFFKK